MTYIPDSTFIPVFLFFEQGQKRREQLQEGEDRKWGESNVQSEERKREMVAWRPMT